MTIASFFASCKTQAVSKDVSLSEPSKIEHFSSCEEYYIFLNKIWRIDSIGIYSFNGRHPNWQNNDEYRQYIDEPCLKKLTRKKMFAILGTPSHVHERTANTTYIYCMDKKCVEGSGDLYLIFTFDTFGEVKTVYATPPGWLLDVEDIY